MAPVRQRIALVAIVVGAVLAVAGMALAANAIWVASRPVAPDQPFDAYYVWPSPWLIPAVFSVGALGDMALRKPATRFGRRAPLIWRTHLLFTTALLIAWLAAGAQVEMTWHVKLLFYATYPLMLIAHGAALAAGGMLVSRGDQPA
jgi:hypothetical protein